MKIKSALGLLLILCLLTTFPNCFCSSLTPVYAQSSGLENLKDIIGNEILGANNINHTISFKLPNSAQVVSPTDWILIDLSNFTNITAASSIGGEYGGTPSYSVDGTTAQVTGITIVPGDTISIQGITATNPLSDDNFGITVKITEDEDGKIIHNTGSCVASQYGSTIFVTASVGNPSARLFIGGYTAPNTIVTFIEGGPIIGTDMAGSGGYFAKLFTGIQPGTHSVSFHGVDENDLTTSIVNLEIYTPIYQTTNAIGYLLSPTIEIHSSSILSGQPLHATGSAYPGTSITVFTDTPVRSYTASASGVGAWTTSITNTSSYTVGDYRIYAIAQMTSGVQSLFSPSLLFSITSSSSTGGTACGDISHGDLNCDDIVNLTDFSILMYYWGTTSTAADINSDTIVDLTDFSIMMYYWGT